MAEVLLVIWTQQSRNPSDREISVSVRERANGKRQQGNEKHGSGARRSAEIRRRALRTGGWWVVRGACLEAASEETLGGCVGLPGVIPPPFFSPSFFLEPGGQGGFQPGTLQWPSA